MTVLPAYVANFSLVEESSMYVTPMLMIGAVPMPTSTREMMKMGRYSDSEELPECRSLSHTNVLLSEQRLSTRSLSVGR